MNRQNPGIGWCDWTWNPISGCRNGCSYCYARAMAERFGRSFEPTFHPKRLKDPAREKKPGRIFVGSTTDFGSKGVDPAWIADVVGAAANAPQHRYMTLTKRPDRTPAPPDNWWSGVTLTRQVDIWRARWGKSVRYNQWASCEPLLGPLDIEGTRLAWIVIGALTGPGGTVSPENGGTRPEWIALLLEEARAAGVPVYVKSNARGLLNPSEYVQQFPKGLEE